MTYYSLLPDRSVLAVSGEDARDFLQGLITKDVKKIKPGKAVFAALLSPQGRFLFDFFITEHDGRLLLEMDRERLPELVKRLTMYRLRSKVAFEPLDIQVVTFWDETRSFDQKAKELKPKEMKKNLRNVENDNYLTYIDPRLPDLGWRGLFNPSSSPVGSEMKNPWFEMPPFRPRQGFDGTLGGSRSDYDHHRLSLGVPEGAKDLITDRSLILEYGYDELGGVDFDKGCYVGQEVTARSKHRATLRKFIHCVQSQLPLPPKGTPVLHGSREAGVMASSSGTLGLAHLKVEEVERAAADGAELKAGDVALEAQLPGWCKTQFQQDSA